MSGAHAARGNSGLTSRQSAAMALIRAADEVRRYFVEFYQAFDLTPQQYNVLRILRGARPHPLPTMEVAERMVEKTPGITRLVDRLEEKGLLVRNRLESDRRQVFVSISPAGLSLLAKLDEPVRKATEGALDMLTEQEVDQLRRLVEKIRSE